MAEQRWERLAAATGIGFVILGVAAYLIAGQPPKAGDSAEQIVSYYTENRDSVVLSGYLWGVAGILFLWFLGSLRAHLRVAEGEAGRLSAVVFGSGLLLGAFFLAGEVTNTALGFGIAQEASSEVSGAFFTLAAQAFAFTAFFVVVFAGATSLVSGRTKVFPAWLGWLGWLVAISGAVGTVAVFMESGAFATGGAYTNIGFGLFFLWFLALAVTMTQQVGRGSRPT